MPTSGAGTPKNQQLALGNRPRLSYTLITFLRRDRMRQLAPVGAGFLVLAATLLWAADGQPRKAQVEPMSQDRFSEIHAPIFQPPKSNNAGALTERIAASLPGAKTSSAPVPRRNFVDQHIF